MPDVYVCVCVCVVNPGQGLVVSGPCVLTRPWDWLNSAYITGFPGSGCHMDAVWTRPWDARTGVRRCGTGGRTEGQTPYDRRMHDRPDE